MAIDFKKIKKPYFIAEIGINHNGDIQIAKRLIDAAFACQWDCVKFQKREPGICVPEGQKGLLYDTPWGRISYLKYKKKIEFTEDEYNYIDSYCKEKPIDWTASVWDLPSLEFIGKRNTPFIKIPSAKITEKELIKKACKMNKPLLVSVGMSAIKEIDETVKLLEKGNANYALMYTNSAYPTPLDELNLSCIETLRKRYNCVVGYSGHEYDLDPTVYAAVLGARIIERHVTLDHNMWGSDHAASLEVHAMDVLHKRIKDIDIILGDGIKKLNGAEIEAKRKLRG